MNTCGSVYTNSHPFTCTLPNDGHTTHEDHTTDAPNIVSWKEHKPLTNATWENYPVFNRDSKSSRKGLEQHGIYWDEQSDLEFQFSELGYDRELVRSIMYGARTSNPVRITWDRKLSDEFRADVQRTTAYVIIEYILRPYGERKYGNQDRMRIRYCGFGHDLYLADLVSAEVPNAQLEFLTLEKD